MRGRPIIDLSGQKFGPWTALAYIREESAWACRCPNGHGRLIRSKVLRYPQNRLPDCKECLQPAQVHRTEDNRCRGLNDRNQDIIQGLVGGKTMNQVSNEHGISKQRVQQVWARHVTDGQREARDSSWYSIKRISEETGRSPSTVANAIKELGLSRGGHPKHSAENAEAVKRYLELKRREKKCKVCGKPGAWACEGDCKSRHVRNMRYELIAHGSKRKPLSGSMPAVAAEALEGVEPGDKFLTFSEALRMLKYATPIQLAWLASRRIVYTEGSSYPHPVTGRPTRLYSRSQIEALATVLRRRHDADR